ncbi:Predicted dehydrogenase [Humidesulfovibrio mexicanus]|uniref:Predicted dehydrogenase n=1 Tax=Humidesulfovibrio mexicanus TaxID=147047 RepID=A0A238YW19_9BACT|nr:Gfo/Idh/MocA family oxidoreductase [Humidesulfovibrio mexicanus]SNR74824.1 Predicted dehydrogenase [Humidesulfovibrio mexicanus]
MRKVGVIGLGSMGKIHLRNYCEMPDVQVLGVMDVAQANLDEAKSRFGVAGFADLDEFLKLDLDAVSISVPTVLHFEVGMKVIERGVALLLEKPLAATAAQGSQLVAAARAKGVPLMVGHIERFNPAILKLKELAGEGLVSVDIERVGPFPARIQDVGVIRDLGSHDLDLLRFLSGADFESVDAVFSTTLAPHEDSAFIGARMKNGVLGHITTNWLTPARSRSIRVACKDRYFVADLIAQQVREYGPFDPVAKTYTVKEHPVMPREQMREELTAFLAAVRGERPLPISGEDGLCVLAAIEKIFAGGGTV